MNILFGYGQKKNLAQQATDSVRKYRTHINERLKNSENYLKGPESPIQHEILNRAKNGQLCAIIDFAELNKSFGLNNADFLFTDEEIDKLIVSVAKYLESEGCDYTVTNQSLTVQWPDPNSAQIEEPLINISEVDK